jgi:hypothetical protein
MSEIRIKSEKERDVENKKRTKEQEGKGDEEKKNNCAKCKLLNEWVDQEQKIVKQKLEYDEM